MKKLYFLALSLLISGTMFSQVFWTEDFGSGCNRGQLASSYNGTNGAWTLASTGTNGNVANTWYVSSTADNTGAGNCADNCIVNSVSNSSLHVSNSSIVIPSFLTVNADTGGSYFTGGFSSFGYTASSNMRAQSPTINCTGMSNIGISFLYFENGDGANDDATLVYSADNGLTWSSVDALAKTTGCASGQWTSFSATLPAGANNNATVKIGFAWTNNDDAQGTDPSFAVDDIALNSNPLGIAGPDFSGINLFAQSSSIVVQTNMAWNLVSVTDVVGQPIQTTQMGNTINVGEHARGIYFVTINVNGQQEVRKVFLQ
jgi:hypothetical protein